MATQTAPVFAIQRSGDRAFYDFGWLKTHHYGQEPDLVAVGKHVVHEIHRPTLIDCRPLSRRFTDDRSSSAARRFSYEQASFAI